MKKPYIQFSKRIVIAVTLAVTAICLAALILCAVAGDAESIVAVFKAYKDYAIIVFAAYSGNSAVEKWLVKKYKDEGE